MESPNQFSRKPLTFFIGETEKPALHKKAFKALTRSKRWEEMPRARLELYRDFIKHSVLDLGTVNQFMRVGFELISREPDAEVQRVLYDGFLDKFSEESDKTKTLLRETINLLCDHIMRTVQSNSTLPVATDMVVTALEEIWEEKLLVPGYTPKWVKLFFDFAVDYLHNEFIRGERTMGSYCLPVGLLHDIAHADLSLITSDYWGFCQEFSKVKLLDPIEYDRYAQPHTRMEAARVEEVNENIKELHTVINASIGMIVVEFNRLKTIADAAAKIEASRSPAKNRLSKEPPPEPV